MLVANLYSYPDLDPYGAPMFTPHCGRLRESWGLRYPVDATAVGLADFIAVNNASIYLLPSDGSSFAGPQDWTQGPAKGEAGMYFVDVTGDGRADFFVVDQASVYVLPAQ